MLRKWLICIWRSLSPLMQPLRTTAAISSELRMEQPNVVPTARTMVSQPSQLSHTTPYDGIKHTFLGPASWPCCRVPIFKSSKRLIGAICALLGSRFTAAAAAAAAGIHNGLVVHAWAKICRCQVFHSYIRKHLSKTLTPHSRAARLFNAIVPGYKVLEAWKIGKMILVEIDLPLDCWFEDYEVPVRTFPGQKNTVPTDLVHV